MLVAPGFVSVAPFSLLCSSSSAGPGYRQIAGVLQQEGADSIEHLLGQKAEDMLLQRTVSDCQMWGMLSRCWENVSLPQVGKALTSIMAELLCSPFLFLIFTLAKAICKFKAVTELRQEWDDYKVQ